MKYKIIGSMGLWEQVNLKEDIKGVLIDYNVERGSTIVWQIYECPYIAQVIIDKYKHLKFEVISDMSELEEISKIEDLLSLQVKFKI